MIHATTLQVRNNYLIRINVDNFGLIIDWSFAITYFLFDMYVFSMGMQVMKKWQKVGRGVSETECCFDFRGEKAETKEVCQFSRKREG